MRSVADLLIAAVILGGPPLLVLWWVRTRADLPTAGEVVQWVQDPLSPRTVIAGVLAVAGLMWLLIAAAVLGAVVRRVRLIVGRVGRMRLPTPAQATASSMAGAAVFGVPATTITAATTVDDHSSTGSSPLATAPHTISAEADVTSRDGAGLVSPMGVDLPDGGWVPQDTARAVASAASLLWLRRRRRYQPGRHGTTTEPDAEPLPRTVTALQAATSTHPGTAADASTSAAPAPSASNGALVTADQLPAGRLILTGPGARDAARGFLVTALLPVADGDGQPRVLTTAADLTYLLGADAAQLPTIPGLHVADSLDDVLHLVGERTDDPGCPAPGTPTETVDADQRTPTALATRPIALTRVRMGVPPARRLTTLVTAGSCLGEHLGGRCREHTCSVTVDGFTAAETRPGWTPGRWCVLSARAATDMLTVIGAAHTDAEPRTVAAAPHRPAAAAPPAPAHRPVTTAHPAAAVGRLRLQALGHVSLTFDGKPVTVRRSAAVQALMLLALYPDGVTTAQLAEAIWPGLRPHTVADRVYTTVSELRRTLRQVTSETVVHRDGDRYLLDADNIDVDVWHLHAATRALASTITAEQRRAALTAVIDACPAELGAGRSWAWLDAPREVLRRQVIDAYAELADTSEPHEALHLLQNALHVDPLNEDLHRYAITALTHAGEHGTAAALTDGYLRRLADAGLNPGPDLTALAHRLHRPGVHPRSPT